MTRRSESGSALIEFAGSLILLATMFAGIFEIGYSFYAYGTLVDAVRAGARYAALQPRGAGADAVVAPAVAKAVRNLVVYGLGGVIVPFVGIKAIDLMLVAIGAT